MGHVSQPTVTAFEDETLLMFFVEIEELTGERIGHAVREIPIRVDISDDGAQGSFQ